MLPSYDDLMKNAGERFTAYIPLMKVDAKRREVWGVGADETSDQAGEIFDYASSRPYVEHWSTMVHKASRGRSLGNIRGQHNAQVAAGRVIDLRFDDTGKRILLGLEVVDPVEWEKVEKGIYTGLSIGGYYVRRFTDPQGRKRYTGAPVEWSLVDVPNNPNAIFSEVIKGGGLVEMAKTWNFGDDLRKGFGSADERAAAFANMKADGSYDPERTEGGLSATNPSKIMHAGKEIHSASEALGVLKEHKPLEFTTGKGQRMEAKLRPDSLGVTLQFREPGKDRVLQSRWFPNGRESDELKSWVGDLYDRKQTAQFHNLFRRKRAAVEISNLKKEGTMENPETVGEDQQEELHEHDKLKARLAAMVDGQVIDAKTADEIWAAIMADEEAELAEEQGESAEEEAAETVQKALAWEPKGKDEGGRMKAEETKAPDAPEGEGDTLEANNDAGDEPGEIAGKQDVKATPAPAGDAPEAGQTGNAPVAAVPPAKPSMTPEATRALILETLVQLGLAEKVGGGPSTGSGQAAAVYQAVKPQMQKAAMTVDHTGEIEALQKAVTARETVETELRNDLAKAIAALQNLEQRGFAGIVVRELGADDMRLAKSQQIGVLNEMLQKSVDPGVRQSLQAEIAALEIKNIRSQK